MSKNSLTGWIVAIVVAIVLAYINLISQRSQAEYYRKQKDVTLLKNLLGTWIPGSEFVIYLKISTTHHRFPRKYFDEMQDKSIAWQVNSLQIHNRNLRKIFNEVAKNLESYFSALFSNTWSVGSSPNATQFFDDNFIQVPPEWEMEDPERFSNAYKQLNQCRIDFITSLDKLFNAIHVN
jgi:hypothetical protein